MLLARWFQPHTDVTIKQVTHRNRSVGHLPSTPYALKSNISHSCLHQCTLKPYVLGEVGEKQVFCQLLLEGNSFVVGNELSEHPCSFHFPSQLSDNF